MNIMRKLNEYNEKLNGLQVEAEKMFTAHLASLEADFKSEEEQVFFRAFKNAYEQTYCKRWKNKKRHWGFWSLVFPILGTSGAGAAIIMSVCTVASQLLSSTTVTVSEKSISYLVAFMRAYGIPCLIFIIAALVLSFSIVCLGTEIKRRDYKETWIRHSVTYHNLNLLIIRYKSGMMDKPQFMEQTLEVLRNNVERFEYNSKAKRPLENKKNGVTG